MQATLWSTVPTPDSRHRNMPPEGPRWSDRPRARGYDLERCIWGGAVAFDRASTDSGQNLLVAGLPAADRRRLLAAGESILLTPGDTLSEAGHYMSHVYFPTGSFVSVRAQLNRDTRLDVALVGPEGMIGVSLALGVDTACLQSMVRGGGLALRISGILFRRELTRSAALRRGLNRYLYVLLSELAQNSACARFHRIDSRLARWLLVTRDRARSDTYHMTHDLLAQMLGVRRVGITVAATSFQRRGLIRYARGDIEILDPPGLLKAACVCYATNKENAARILG
jgi:CRP-like cAMP-binding protein